ncbi:hypothetical protein D9758_017847 [Tetrapyrgos nigripes]|uniref:BZIP domain-containing protein n=1 Tax=Tetrapyrgos nigripes TaxID=182062 RepID=A0A8H5BSI8_9AGAR|nr:hypothetical protein D9758_017847 [Tetrapyrgos nigripes]
MAVSPMHVDSSACPSSPSSSTQKVAYANVYRWDHSPSVLLSSASPAVNGSPLSRQELTSSHRNRNARPPSVLPQTTHNCKPSPVAISDSSHNLYYRQTSQDVRYSLNISAAPEPSTASSHHGQPSLERSLSSPYSHHVPLNQFPSPQPVFTTQSQLAAHYGIPQSLPKPPRTTPRSSVAEPVDPLPTFSELSRNYLNMLSQKPDNTMPAESSPALSTTALPADMDAPVTDAAAIVADTILGDSCSPGLLSSSSSDTASPLLASPHYRDLNSFPGNEFLTSPFMDTPYDEFLSPDNFDSPFSPDLNTPLMADLSSFEMLTGYNDAPLFDDLATSIYSDYASLTTETAKEVEPVKEHAQPAASTSFSNPTFDMEKLYTFSPGTPMLDAVEAVDPSSLYPSPRIPKSKEFSPAPTSAVRKTRSSATGTRKNITTANLVPLDAPTQSRHYATPSATSRKEVPAVFARKRNRSQAFGDEEDELVGEAPGPNASEKEQIEWKRRQNTLAARKSRKRKLEHQQSLENKVDDLMVEVERWKTKAQTLEQILRSHGVPFSFDADESM